MSVPQNRKGRWPGSVFDTAIQTKSANYFGAKQALYMDYTNWHDWSKMQTSGGNACTQAKSLGAPNIAMALGLSIGVKSTSPTDTTHPPYMSFADVAAGKADTYYNTWAVNVKPTYPQLYIRIGWEQNGWWYPWSIRFDAANNYANWIAAFRRIVTVVRNVLPNCKIVWNPNLGETAPNPQVCWPGASYVDIISGDLYDNFWSGGSQGPEKRWAETLQPTQGGWGLNAMKSFATAQGKPMAISEWGAGINNSNPSQSYGDDPVWIQHCIDYFDANNFDHIFYWDFNDGTGYNGLVNDNSKPDQGAILKTWMGGAAPTAVDLLIANATSAQTAGKITITQRHYLTSANARSAQTASSPIVVRTTKLIPASGAQAQTVGSPVLAGSQGLTLAGMIQAQTAGSPALTGHHYITLQGLKHAQTAGNVILGGTQFLTVAGATQAQTAGNVTLSRIQATLSPNNAAQAQTAGSPTLASIHVLPLSSLSHAQTAGTPTLIRVTNLALADATHAQSVDDMNVADVSYILAMADLSQAQTADSLDIDVAYGLYIDDVTHAQLSTLSGFNGNTVALIPSDVVHAHLIESPDVVRVISSRRKPWKIIRLKGHTSEILLTRRKQ